MAASRTMKAGEVRRAKVILQLAAGQSYRTISKQQGCGQDFVARWKARFVKERLAGLYARHRGKRIKPKQSVIFWPIILRCAFITRRPIRHGSTKSKSGSLKSNVISLPAASLPPSKIWIEKSCAIFA